MIQELFEIIRPRITPRVLEVVHNHLTDEQIGLLLVKLINPYVVLTQQEEAILRGVNRKTLRGMKARGEVPACPDASVGGVNRKELPIFPQKAPKRAKKFPQRGKEENPL
jgi:hypothetical protein